jgi:hypothetical protein
MNAAALLLRALGGASPPPEPAAPARLSDPTGDALTHHLVDAGLWRFGAGMELTRDGSRLSIRIFMPEVSQSHRELGGIEAGKVREALVLALMTEGYIVKFSDSLWCERGHKGWVVLAKAQGRA